MQAKQQTVSFIELICRERSKSERQVFLNFRISGKRIPSFRKYFLLIWTSAKETIWPE